MNTYILILFFCKLFVPILLFIPIFLILDHYSHVQANYPNKQGVKGYIRYLRNELKHKRAGDKRDDFEKIIDRCKLLRSSRCIYNAGGGC